jgi:glucosamine kinase
MAIIIADSGATKCEWCLVDGKKKKTIFTTGISPYFLTSLEVQDITAREVMQPWKRHTIEAIFFYGTGCKNPDNRNMIKRALRKVFPDAEVAVDHDLMGAAKALCGHTKGIACILGTGSNSCYYNGKRIVQNSPGLGYVLGDEGSGAFLGKRVIQHYLYDTFDEDLRFRFDDQYKTNAIEILEQVYKKPLPNRYLASYARFLADNRGHFMVENIIEDGLNDFFFQHLCKYRESWRLPIHFTGGVSFAFQDVITQLCHSYEFELGRILKNPMDGLIEFHQ